VTGNGNSKQNGVRTHRT